MDIVELLSEKTVSVALAIVVMYFYNKLVIDFLQERKEMIEALRTERREWLASSTKYLETLFEVSRTSTEAIALLRSEMHSLKSRITELMLQGRKGAGGGNESS